MVQEMERASVSCHRIGMREVNSNGIAARPSKWQQFRQGPKPVFALIWPMVPPAGGAMLGEGASGGAGMRGHPYPRGVIFREADPCRHDAILQLRPARRFSPAARAPRPIRTTRSVS